MFLDYVEDNGIRYFNLFSEPTMVEMSIDTGEILKYSHIGGRKCQEGAYINLFIYNSKILSVPLHSDVFSLYNLELDNVSSIPIPSVEIAKKNYGYFIAAVQKKQFVYAFGYNYPGIVKVDIEKEKAELLIDLRSWEKLNNGFISACFQIDNIVYIPIENSTCIVLFDLNSDEFHCFNMELKDGTIIRTIYYDGIRLWVIMNNGDAYIIDCQKDIFIKDSVLSEYLKALPIITYGAFCNGYAFLFPQEGNKIVQYSHNDKLVKLLEVPINNVGNCFYSIINKVNELSFFCYETNCVYSYNDTKQKFEKSKKQLSDKNYLNYMVENDVGIVKEGELFSLDLFLKEQVLKSGGECYDKG